MNDDQAPTPEQISAAEREGALAAEARQSFITDCPYTYDKFSRLGMSPPEFAVLKRPLLDAWFKGRKAYLDERGLGNDLKPFKRKESSK